jgi:hypothetical protein
VNTIAAQFTFGGRTYLAINLAGNGFNDSDDLLLDITGFTGTIRTAQAPSGTISPLRVGNLVTAPA